jgi:hypothetical protein
MPYGDVKHYDQETMTADLVKQGVALSNRVTEWLSAVPYTLDATDNVLNKWGDATYEAIAQADFHILVETHYDLAYYVPGYVSYDRTLAPSSITEKTNKPIASSKPFIVFATPHFLEDLRSLGYKTYAPFINESYDTEEDNHKRLNMIVAEIERISELPKDEYNELLFNCRLIAAKNREILLSKKDNTAYNAQFYFLRDYFEPQSNIQIL